VTRPGVVFAAYLFVGGLERFLVEFIRRNDAVAVGLTTAQVESRIMMLAGAVWLVLIGRGGGLRTAPSDQLGPTAPRPVPA